MLHALVDAGIRPDLIVGTSIGAINGAVFAADPTADGIARMRRMWGEVAETDFWGKRRFAYEINHVNEGYYSVVQFLGEPALVATLDRALSLADNVVRHKILRIEEKKPA